MWLDRGLSLSLFTSFSPSPLLLWRANTVCILSANPETHSLYIVGQSGGKKHTKKHGLHIVGYSGEKKHGLHIVGHSEKNTVCTLSATQKKTRSAYCRPVRKNMFCILSAYPEKDGLHIRVGQSRKKDGLHIHVGQSGKTRSDYCWSIRKNTVCILSSNQENHVLDIVFQSGKTRSAYSRPIRRGWCSRGTW